MSCRSRVGGAKIELVFAVNQGSVFLECLKATLANGPLQRSDRLRIEQMIFAIRPEVIIATDRQLRLKLGRRLECVLVPHQRFPRQHF